MMSSFLKIESELQKTITFCKNLQERQRISIKGSVKWKWSRKKKWKCLVTLIKRETYKSNGFPLQNLSLIFIVKSYSLPSTTSVLSHSPVAHNTTSALVKPTCTNYVDIGWFQDRFWLFLGLKLNPTTWMYNLKCSGKMTTKCFDWYKILQWEKQVSTSSCDWRISWSLQQKTLVEGKNCPQRW